MSSRRATKQTKTGLKQVILKPHHRKPYRKRHLSTLVVSLLILGLFTVQIGVFIGREQSTQFPDQPPAASVASSVTIIQSDYGFSLAVDSNLFNLTATQQNAAGLAQPALSSNLDQKLPLISLAVTPKPGTVNRVEAASQLTIQVNPDSLAFTAAKAKAQNANLSAGQIAELLFPVLSPSGFDKIVSSTKSDTLSGVAVQKTVYKFSPRFSGGASYAVVWSGESSGRAFSIQLQGLVGESDIPAAFDSIFTSLRIDSSKSVLGAATLLTPNASAGASKLNSKYLSDAVSPAVVKIYHLVCGSLVLNNTALTTDSCAGFSGSGFLASSNGYIATNGHVVVYSAQDALVDILTSNPSVLQAFLKSLGLDANQIASVNQSPATLASIIAQIYDVPDSTLSFKNKKDVVLVGLGDNAPNFNRLKSSADIASYQKDTPTVKVADVIGYNYTAKDTYTAIADPSKGFSSSDVALLKIKLTGAPALAISTTPVTQNQKIVLLGFPGDADNQLTDNSQLNVTVTDGVISSIRKAAGGHNTLYQSDADASHGNSGGPAVDENGTVLGLLTYRASGDASGNAAKSYIRDIDDFVRLAGRKQVIIDGSSSTQRLWQAGLSNYAQNHFSAALIDFGRVQQAYPAHRLVANYIGLSKQAISDGKDVKQMPLSIIIGGLVIAFLVTAASVVLIVRHHSRHTLYKAYADDPPKASAKL